uniref:Uncharacterized protein n=1 Tax=Steinernema glaseri TaxID=37863 RepID=A0A1I7ZER2_9BILA
MWTMKSVFVLFVLISIIDVGPAYGRFFPDSRIFFSWRLHTSRELLPTSLSDYQQSKPVKVRPNLDSFKRNSLVWKSEHPFFSWGTPYFTKGQTVQKSMPLMPYN